MYMSLFKKRAVCILMIVVFLFAIIACSSTDTNITNKEVVHVHSTWATYSFDNAVDIASQIVYGTVADISDTKIHEAIGSASGHIYEEYYKEVTIDIISCPKGAVESDTCTYLELGGETDTQIFIYDGMKNVSLGDTVLLFLGDNGSLISVDSLFHVNNGIVSVSDNMLPSQSSYSIHSSTDNNVSISSYIEMIQAELDSGVSVSE